MRQRDVRGVGADRRRVERRHPELMKCGLPRHAREEHAVRADAHGRTEHQGQRGTRGARETSPEFGGRTVREFVLATQRDVRSDQAELHRINALPQRLDERRGGSRQEQRQLSTHAARLIQLWPPCERGGDRAMPNED